MADIKISQLPSANLPLDGTEVLPIVQSTTTKKVSVANVTSGRAISAASLALTTPLTTGNGGTGTSTDFTAGSVIFAGASGIYSQNNSRLFWDNTNFRFGVNTTSPAVSIAVNSTDAVLLPVGTTGERPTGAKGYIRYNDTLTAFEGHNGSTWGPVGSPGGSTTQIQYNSAGVFAGSANYTFDGTNVALAGTMAMGSSFIRNRIINGGMRIDQRNNGSAVTTASSYPVDRFYVAFSTDGAFSAQRDTTAPVGFVNSLKFTTTTADSSLSATQFSGIVQKIEGSNLYDLAWGTASAKTVTLSFWVRSSLTGVFGGSISNSAANRSYPFTYTIVSADTWEYKTITIPGDTTGTWLTTTGVGVTIVLGLGVGSTYSGTANSWAATNYLSATSAVSVIGTLNATFYVTGVQFEVGSVSTPFELRQYTTELQLCQRYLPAYNATSTSSVFGSAYAFATTGMVGVVPFQVQARTAPTGITASNASHFSYNSSAALTLSAIAFSSASDTAGVFTGTVTGANTGYGGNVSFNSASGQLLFTGCEL